MSSAAPLARVNTGKKGKMRKELDRQAFVDEKNPSLSSGSTLPSRRRVVDIRRLSYRRMRFYFKLTKENEETSEEVKMVVSGSRSNPNHPLEMSTLHFLQSRRVYKKATMIMPATPARAILLASRATPAFWGPLVTVAMGAPEVATVVGWKAVELTAVPTD